MEENANGRQARESLEIKIQRAITGIVEKKGFSNVSVEQICNEAKIEPSEFNSRYRDLEDALDKFVRLYDYWLADLVKTNKKTLGIRHEFFKKLIDGIDSDRIMREILLWNRNYLAQRTITNQILKACRPADILKPAAGNPDIDLNILFSILIGGIYFINQQKEFNTYLYSGKGKDSVLEVIIWIVDNLDTPANKKDNRSENKIKIEIARKMLRANIDIKTIREVTGLTDSRFLQGCADMAESPVPVKRKRGRPPKMK
jgi:AcrR family transcriptional regulator